MAGSSTQPLMRQTEVDADNWGIDQGGSGCLDIGTDIFGGGTIGTDIQFRDMGLDT